MPYIVNEYDSCYRNSHSISCSSGSNRLFREKYAGYVKYMKYVGYVPVIIDWSTFMQSD